MNKSAPCSLNRADVDKWTKNMIVFIAPVALVYLAQITGTISQADNIIELSDFVPSQVTLGAMILYVINSVTDIIKKFLI